MSTLDERTAYKDNPFFTGHIYGNFSPFYVTIAVCTVVLGSIIILNIIFGCCSKHRQYWQDRHTGNRWLVSIWSATPHNQPPLDFTELKDAKYFQSLQPAPRLFSEDIEAQIEDVPVHHHHQYQQRPSRPEGRGLHQQRQPVAALALFIVGVIIIMLRFGPRLCGLRHHALPDSEEYRERAYDHEISYA